MFKEMRPIGLVTEVPTPPGETHTHANYLEVVTVQGQRLDTVLSCDVKSAPTWAAMTYDLDHSVGGVLQVDRGYLLAVDVAGRRQVKALKVIGFTDTLLNAAATTICPEWGMWVRRATVHAAARTSGSVDPTPGSLGDSDPGLWDPIDDGAAGFTAGYGQQWTDTVTDMAQFYSDYATDVGSRLWSGRYQREDAAQDSGRLFLRLARDWSRAWQAGTDVAVNWADADIPPRPGRGPSGAGRTIEHTTLLVPPQIDTVPVSVTDLTQVSSEPATLAASHITPTPATVRPSLSPAHVTIQADTTTTPCGLYQGELILGDPAADRVPALFYVSKARPTP